MLVWVAKLSLTCATSPMVTGAPLNTPIGSSLNRSTVVGLELSCTLYSRSPMRAVPAGHDDVGGLQRVHHVGRREALCRQQRRIEIDDDLPLLAAERRRAWTGPGW